MDETIKTAPIEKLDEIVSTVGENRQNVLLLILYFILRIPVGSFISADPKSPHWKFVGVALAFYIIVGMLIWNNRRNLSVYHFDKLAIILIIVSGIVLRKRVYDNVITLSLEISIFIFAIILWILLSRSKIKFETFQLKNRWVALAILIGLVIAVSRISATQHIQQRQFGSIELLSVLVFDFISNMVVQVGSTIIIEESIYRGFLWGTLRNYQWQDNKILILQGFLFWISHLYYWNHPITFFFTLPIFCFLVGFLAQKSKSIIPSIILHAMYNAAAGIAL